MNWQIFISAALLLVATYAGCDAATPARVRTRAPGVLRIGTYFVNPPFEYISNGDEIGFEVDLMTEVARRLGLRPSFVNTHWERILRQMREGRYDCIVGGITITPARQRVLAWSTPYMITTLSLIVDPARTPWLRDIAELKAAIVGVQAATTDYEAAVAMKQRGQIRKIQVYPFDRIGSAMSDLVAGRITAVMKVAPVARWLAHHTPGLRVIGQVPDDPQPLGIGFQKSNPELAAAVDAILMTIESDGTFGRLTRKWDLLDAR